MQITKLTKESNLKKDSTKITIEITVSRREGYRGFDVFPDDLIPDLLVAVGRAHKVKKGRIVSVGLNGTNNERKQESK